MFDVCNRVRLHIVFVLLYSVCSSVNVLSCVDVLQSFTYVLRIDILDVTKRRGARARGKVTGDTNGLSQIMAKNIINNTGTSGCASFLVAYFQPATCIDRLHVCSQQGDIRQQQQQKMTN